MNIRQASCFSAMIIVMWTLSSCTTSEDRIRKIAKAEMASSLKRTPITDAKTIGPYNPAQQVGNFLFISGQIALDQQTGLLNNTSIESETRQTLDNLMNILQRAGCDSTDVVTTTVYLKDIADYPKMNLIYGGYFTEGNYPARTTVQVAALPHDARIEISAIAYTLH